MKVLLQFILFFAISSSMLFAQDEMMNEKVNDSTATSTNENIESGFNLPFFNNVNYIESNIPTIQLDYGFTQASYNDSDAEFNDLNLMGIKIGFTDIKSINEEKSIIEFDYDYVFLNHISNELGGEEAELNEINTNAWQWGFGKNSGYGWQLGEKTSITLYNGGRLTWTKIDVEPGADVNLINDEPINNFGDAFRFGSTFEGGVRFRVIKNVGINAEYTRTQVFPRHMFWYWTGSGIIEGIGDFMVGYFVRYVRKSSPELVPIVDFVLRNAISYGFSELRSEKMNWPFSTAAPFDYQTFKVGLSFYF